MHALGQRTILRCHLRDAVEDRLQAVGLLGALLALGAQLGGTLLHRGALLGAEAAGLGHGILRGHSRASFPDAQGLGVVPALHRKARPEHTVALLHSCSDRGQAEAPLLPLSLLSAEGLGSGAGWPAAGAARLAGIPGAGGHAHLARRFSRRGRPLWCAGTGAVTSAPSPTSNPGSRTDRMRGSSLSADRRRRASAAVFFPHRKAWLSLSRNSSRGRRAGASRPAGEASPPGRQRDRQSSSSWSRPGR